MANDPYEVLGVPRTASAIEIHAAYRRLAAELRPDGLRGDDASEARFREVDSAYEVLSDARRRTEYDRTGVIPPPTAFEAPAEARPAGGAGAERGAPDARDPAQAQSYEDLVFPPLVAGVVFLYFGYVQALVGISGDALYDLSVDVFRWMARIVGIGLLLVAAAAYARQPFARMLDLAVSVVAAFGCLVVGAIWLAHSDSEGILILLLAAVNAWSANSAWKARAAR
ncbi:MAG: DnaJ domain-containing protein [Phycisphaerales bacterium]|nr:DnaJ domain-containing protein [Phycisphaerales bacterium]